MVETGKVPVISQLNTPPCKLHSIIITMYILAIYLMLMCFTAKKQQSDAETTMDLHAPPQTLHKSSETHGTNPRCHILNVLIVIFQTCHLYLSARKRRQNRKVIKLPQQRCSTKVIHASRLKSLSLSTHLLV